VQAIAIFRTAASSKQRSDARKGSVLDFVSFSQGCHHLAAHSAPDFSTFCLLILGKYATSAPLTDDVYARAVASEQYVENIASLHPRLERLLHMYSTSKACADGHPRLHVDMYAFW
jgi:hypothetical protein